MNRKPGFIDNRDGNTLARALRMILEPEHRMDEPVGPQTQQPPQQVSIATAFFSPTGFAHIADLLAPVEKVRLLLGADLTADLIPTRKHLNETQDRFEHRRIEEGLHKMDDRLTQERDRLPFTRANAATIRKLIRALRSGNMEVRRYEKAFLHAKAYIFNYSGDELGFSEGVIAGSSNLTGAGLMHNLELNLGRFDHPMGDTARQWFDDLWEDAEPYDLAAIFEQLFTMQTPWEVFVRVLWHLYGQEIEQETEEEADGDLPLTGFQQHGVARALRLIEDVGGAIVADEVGLGKTFIAGEILKRYHQRRQRVLLICPAALRDSTWKTFINTHQIFCESLSYEQLASDEQLRDQQRPNANQTHLKNPLHEYQLIIVDEAHNYRNPDAPTRAAALRRLLSGPRRDLLLLTATPVNNSLWDLYHLLRFFLRQDAHLASRGILSIRDRFEQAMKEDPSNLSPDLLYPIIDATTVKRTRQFIQKYYAGDQITAPDGRLRTIQFPKPTAISVRYQIDDLLPEFFDSLEAALDPDNKDAISFTRYTPDRHLLKQSEADASIHPHTILGLLRCGLLKRFESSAHAFHKSVEKMVREHDHFLQALDAGRVVTTAFLKEVSAVDDAQFEELLKRPEHSEDAALYDVKTLRKAVTRDRKILQKLADRAAQIKPENDPKLKVLTDALIEITAQAQEERENRKDEAQKRKTLIFSSFEDTVTWIRNFLKNQTERQPELAPYRDRIVAVSGSGDLDEPSRQKAAQGFAPISMEATSPKENDLYDLMVSTDVLAEGVNLQQCRHIINFDMPWNPMRLVQRHGRIDRINSPHKQVFLRTVFPDDRLEQLLNLEQRILNKLAMAAASIGVAAPIQHAAHGTQVFTETREEIEKLLQEDPSLFERGGSASAAQTGEEYRQILRQMSQSDRERIISLPWKIGSGMVKGKQRGIFFFAVAGRGDKKYERNYVRFIPADKQWQPQPGRDDIKRELGTCLRLIECKDDTPTWCPDMLQERVYDFWTVAQDDILIDWNRETDPANLQPKVRPLNQRVAEFIRNHPPAQTSGKDAEKALDILESPWPRRDENMLRQWFESKEYADADLSRFLVQQILNSGLEATKTPEALPLIAKDDIELLCWMGIEAEENVSDTSA